MIETITIITLCVLYLVFFRPGKTPPLNNPLVIDRPGKYHATLAPHINLAQPFVEAIAQNLLENGKRAGNCDTQYFDVTDKHVKAHGKENYLLAISQRDGLLVFQAAAPAADISHLQTITEFATEILEKFPATGESDSAIADQIVSAAQQVASNKQIQIDQIS